MTALSFRQKEQFFHELAQLSRSAIPLPQAFEILARNARSQSGRCARQVKESLHSSGKVSKAFRETGFSPSDAAVIEAGESTGRLDAVFTELETYYRQLAEARQRVITRSIYPVLVLHLGAVLLAIPPAIIAGGWPTFLANALPILVGFYALLIATFAAGRAMTAALARSPAAAQMILAIPALGGFYRDWTAWKFSTVLALYVRAGGRLMRAFEVSGAACGNALLRRASKGTITQVQAGHSLAEAVRSQSGWPHILERAIEVGEHSGRLDEETQRAADLYKQRTLGKLDAISHWSPRVIYIAIALFTGYRIISMALNVATSVGSALDGSL